MDSLELKARLKAGKPVFGTWSHLPLVQVVEIVGSTGFDFMVFDLEHGPFSFSDLPALYCAAENSGMVPVTRVPGLEASAVLRVLDSGTKGVMVPHVDSLDMARQAVTSMFYGPAHGSRGVAALTRSSMFGKVPEKEHFAGANAGIVSCLMVEDKAGIDALDDICAIPGLDIVFVGIYDLSQSMGWKAALDAPEFLKLVEKTVRRIRDKGVSVGTYAPHPSGVKRLLDIGVNVVTLNVDGGMLRRAYQAYADDLAAYR